ncbi:MAG: hypothetical protein VYC34_03880, partial [Planctomycetota bacterium]|nr:hypothetical protein [Planctomycetota bacterium]
LLAEYEIRFYGWSAALIGTLLLAKVVLILEKVPLGRWVRQRPAWVAVILRTILYVIGVVIVLALEHGIRGRHEHGGFFPAIRNAFHETNDNRIWVNTICIALALLFYNVLAVLRERIGDRPLLRIFFAPPPDVSAHERSD